MKLHLQNFVLFFTLVFLSLLWGCGDDISKPHEEHYEAEGMVIYDGQTKIYEYFAPDYDENDQFTDDTIRISLGQTNLLTTKFLDENRNEIDPPHNEQEFGIEIGDDKFVEAILQVVEGRVSFEFYLVGKAVGTTTIKFQILHEGHADFTTLTNHIVVE